MRDIQLDTQHRKDVGGEVVKLNLVKLLQDNGKHTFTTTAEKETVDDIKKRLVMFHKI